MEHKNDRIKPGFLRFFLVKWKNLGYERQEGLPSEINMTVFF